MLSWALGPPRHCKSINTTRASMRTYRSWPFWMPAFSPLSRWRRLYTQDWLSLYFVCRPFSLRVSIRLSVHTNLRVEILLTAYSTTWFCNFIVIGRRLHKGKTTNTNTGDGGDGGQLFVARVTLLTIFNSYGTLTVLVIRIFIGEFEAKFACVWYVSRVLEHNWDVYTQPPPSLSLSLVLCPESV